MTTCTIPPPGWHCTRPAQHEGPCAALPNGEAEREHTAFVEQYALASAALALGTEMHRQGVSQRELADLLGVSAPRVSQLLSAASNPTIKSLARAAGALGCRVRIILEPHTKPTKEAP